jgi:hypothetical protein
MRGHQDVVKKLIPALATAAALLAGCAEAQQAGIPASAFQERAVIDAYGAAFAQAGRACHSFPIEDNHTIAHEKYPMIDRHTVWFRCEADGRVVGPYAWTEQR